MVVIDGIPKHPTCIQACVIGIPICGTLDYSNVNSVGSGEGGSMIKRGLHSRRLRSATFEWQQEYQELEIAQVCWPEG